MKKTLLSVLGLLCFIFMQAQVSKTVNMTEAGMLAYLLTAEEQKSITDLSLTGPIDARDFKTMRDCMPQLEVLDLKETNIFSYSGSDGTCVDQQEYPANEIPKRAFYSGGYIGNEVLRSLILPSGLVSIGDEAFSLCYGLAGELQLPSGVTAIGNNAFLVCDGLTGELQLPSGLLFIGDDAFSECSGFTGELVLPSGLLSIGDNAFKYCSGLTSIRSFSSVPPKIRNNTFEFTNFKCVFVPNGSKQAYLTSSFWNRFSIIDEEISYSLHIASPGSLRESLLKAGGNPLNVTSLALTGELNNEDFLQMRDNMPLLYCIDLKGIVNKSIPENAFKNKLTLLSVRFPAGLTIIEKGAFSECYALSGELQLSDRLQSIGDSAFSECRGLTGSLILPSALTAIGNRAFTFCDGLKNVQFPEGLVSIGDGAFEYCDGLTGDLNLPLDLRSIGDYAFYDCNELTHILIKKNLKSIGECAFSFCSKILKFSCETLLPPNLGANVFEYVDTQFCELHVPKGRSSHYKSADQWSSFVNVIEMEPSSEMLNPGIVIRVWTLNGQLFIESIDEMASAVVIDMSGRMKCSISKTANIYELGLREKGVYVVRIRMAGGKEKTMKVII